MDDLDRHRRPMSVAELGDLCWCPAGQGAGHYWHPRACPAEAEERPDAHAIDPHAVTCKSTRYGPGCGHSVASHNGTGDCCCCNHQHNDPEHGAACASCRPIIRAYLLRQYGNDPLPAKFREPGDVGYPPTRNVFTGRVE